MLIDHRSGLFQTVKNIDQRDLRNNVIALAKTAKTFNIPMITTSSVPNGPNGALIPEIHEILRDLPYFPKNGKANAWEEDEFVEAVKKLWGKTLLLLER